MNKEEINKWLIEFMGYQTYKREYRYKEKRAIHTVYFDPSKPVDRKKNKVKKTPDFFSPEGFFKLWNWAIEKEWWEDFERDLELPRHWIPRRFINPETFPIKLYEFLRSR